VVAPGLTVPELPIAAEDVAALANVPVGELGQVAEAVTPKSESRPDKALALAVAFPVPAPLGEGSGPALPSVWSCFWMYAALSEM